MKQIMLVYWRIVTDLLEVKSFVIPLILVTVLAHGYRIGAYCLGLDSFDHFALNHYCNMSYYVAQNRWGIGLLSLILGCGQEVPFYSNFLLVLFLFVTTLALCALFRRVDSEIKTSSLTIFGCVFISYPIYGEVLMYPSAVIDMCGYLLVTCSVIALYEYVCVSGSFRLVIAALCCLVFALSIYESNIILHSVLIFAVLLLLYRKDRVKSNEWPKLVLKYGLFLFCCCTVLFAIGYGLMAVTGVSAASVSSRTITWLSSGPLIDKILMLLASIAGGYVYFGLFYYPLFLFNVVAIVALISSFIWSVRSRSWSGLLLVSGLLASNLALSLLQGIMTPYRAASGLGVTCAFLMLIGLEVVKSGHRRVALLVICAYVAFFQAKELTLWTWNDFHTFELDVSRATLLGHDIQRKFGVNVQKPVLFIGVRDVYPYERLNSKSMFDLGTPRLFDVSPLCNGESYFMRDNFTQTEREFLALLKYCGYAYHRATLDQKKRVLTNRVVIDNFPIWPQEGSIVEVEGCIVVHLGQPSERAVGRRELLKRKVKILLNIS
jgi:hypothetical protein